MKIRQTRIFAPFNESFKDNWAENIMGRIIKPVVEKHALNWFWFSRYDGAISGTDNAEDCNVAEIRNWYKTEYLTENTRSLRFRYSASDKEIAIFEKELETRIKKNGCKSEFREYLMVEDLGSNRHVGGDRSEARRQNRAKLLTELYYSISKLTLDNLEDSEGANNFTIEINDTAIGNSSFSVSHHLFYNIAKLPLPVKLIFQPYHGQQNSTEIRTDTGWGIQDGIYFPNSDLHTVPLNTEKNVHVHF